MTGEKLVFTLSNGTELALLDSMKWIYALVIVASIQSWALETENRTLIVGKDQNQSLHLNNVQRVAVGNSKIVKVRSLNSGLLLVTGIKVGRTSVRVWAGDRELAYDVAVVPPDVVPGDRPTGREGVARVSLQFLEIDTVFSKGSGFRWPDSIAFSGTGNITGNSDVSGVNYAVSFASAQGFIRLMVNEGWAKVLASPELYVRLGEQAVFHSGGEFPVATGTEAYGRYQKQVEWKKFGLTAKVKPESIDELRFSTDIQLEISEPGNSYALEDVPSINRRNLETKMNSLDNETVILSGLTRQNSQTEETKIPVLGDIPLLGSLFSSKEVGKQQTDLLMAVTIAMTTRARENEKLQKLRGENADASTAAGGK